MTPPRSPSSHRRRRLVRQDLHQSLATALVALLVVACGNVDGGPHTLDADVAGSDVSGGDAGTDDAAEDTASDAPTSDGAMEDAAAPDAERDAGRNATRAIFDPESARAGGLRFFDAPFPSDLRTDDGGRPNWSGFPNPRASEIVSGIVSQAQDRVGFGQFPVTWFRFDGELAPRSLSETIAPSWDAPIQLVDVDEDSPQRGRLFPVVAHTLPEDPYTPSGLLAVAPHPGIILMPSTRYAVVIRAEVGDANRGPLEPPAALEAFRAGEESTGEIDRLLAPLGALLDEEGIDRASVVHATVFTTGDVVARLSELTRALRERHGVAPIEELALDPEDGSDHARFCELHGVIELPQFQQGSPPFDTEGLFDESAGLPAQQRTARIPVALTLPHGPMPPDGWPLVYYFHGSGGLSTQVVDRGPVLEPGGERTPGLGPSHVLAAHGFATIGVALPVNPQRVEGAGRLTYINPNNLPAYRDTNRQGVIEATMVLDALEELSIEPELLAQCPGIERDDPEAEGSIRADWFGLMGQSQGAIYANMIATVDSRPRALAPTGSGAFWSHQVLITEDTPLGDLLALVLGTPLELTWTHPAMGAFQTAWETADPIVFAPRYTRDPLPGFPPRSVYQPVGLGDTFYPPPIFDALALAFGNRQAGEEVWPSMQEFLSLSELDGLVPYPAADTIVVDGESVTAVVVQYRGDGLENPHGIFAQLDEVKRQYGCFFETSARTGRAVVPAPTGLGTPCPLDD